ncbi:putative CC-NBS-LRR resistance protein, partial [Trifolium pratense]
MGRPIGYICGGEVNGSSDDIACVAVLVNGGFGGITVTASPHAFHSIMRKHLEITDAKVLEEKKTTSGFRKLDMGERYKGEHFSNWLSPLSNIVDITLHNCEGLKYLPPMERLRFL